jgi:hypothetical protein
VSTHAEGTPPVAGGADGPGGIHRFARTTPGTLLAAGLIGLADAIERRPKEVVSVVADDDTGEPPFAGPLLIRLDPDDPRDSVVIVRRTTG